MKSSPGADIAMTTVHEIFEKMPESFQKTAAAEINAVIRFHITGDGGGTWHAVIADGALEIHQRDHEAPNLIISATAEDYVAISTGTLNEQLAFMTGRITAKGDLLLAMKLPKLFKRTG